MPFQSEKQRRYLHANHPEIAKRWEKEYSNGGILDITGDEQITTNEGNDISLVDESETGVSTLFMRKGGPVHRHQLAKKNTDGSRPGYYGPDEGHENDPGHGSNSNMGGGNGGNNNNDNSSRS